eukprot:9019359-Pyramimonas_sp.AAC.1
MGVPVAEVQLVPFKNYARKDGARTVAIENVIKVVAVRIKSQHEQINHHIGRSKREQQQLKRSSHTPA